MRALVRFGACSALLLGPLAGEASALERDVGLGIAAGYVQAREDLLSPLVLRGPGGLLTASFAGRAKDSELETRLYAGLALLVDRYDTKNGAVSAGINSRWRWDLRHGTHAAVRLGPMLDVHSWIAQYSAWDDSHAYWLGVISAGPMRRLPTMSASKAKKSARSR